MFLFVSTVSVSSFVVAQGGAVVVLSPSSGSSGTVVTVSGSGFSVTAGTTVDVRFDGSIVVSNVVTSNGAFSATFVVPSSFSSAGSTLPLSKLVVAVDSSVASNTASATFTLTGLPVVSINPTVATPGVTDVAVIGEHFSQVSGTSVSFRVMSTTGSASYAAGQAVVRADGTFATTIKIPSGVPVGSYWFNVTDTSGLSARTALSVASTIVLSPSSGPSGTVVDVSGYGFSSTEGVTVDIKFDGSTVKSNAPTSSGTFTTTFIVPFNANAEQTLPIVKAVTAVDSSASSNTASATFTLTGLSSITINPIVAAPGVTDVTITGANFSRASGTSVSFRAMSTSSSASYAIGQTTVNSDGSFSVTLTIPTGIPTGSYWLNATDTNGLTAKTALGIASPTVNTTPNATLETGQTIKVSGSGFNALDDALSGMFDTPITANITIGGITVVSGRTLQQIADGVSVEIPDVSAGTQTVKIITNISGLTAETDITCIGTSVTNKPSPTATSTAKPTASAPTTTTDSESTFPKTAIIAAIIIILIILALVFIIIIRRRQNTTFNQLSY
ncbi:MAG: hypothetical protein FWF66_03320 [Candidatus Bathyarchaeota archaeon]|nr:hypothetical protein [Candidatus Termiticorpusculum sp.]